MPEPLAPPRAQIVGAGLMGGSVGMGLRAQGWHVSGHDIDGSSAGRGVARQAFDAVGLDETAELVVICTPVLAVADLAKQMLVANPRAIVTDIGSVKGPIVAAVDHPRFIGGHPMAGSEQDGIDGSTASMFEGRPWVLTPTASTDADAYTKLHGVLTAMGATVLTLAPERHDELVAIVSHVPHLTAATLMDLAATTGERDTALLRLAAGGFRDMTRIAAGGSAIWLDICTQNRTAILTMLDRLIGALTDMRTIVDDSDRERLFRVLERARVARINLPTGAPPPEELAELRVPIPDRPGFIAEITSLASLLGVNLYDVEMMHSAEGDEGVFVMTIALSAAELFRGGLLARGFRCSVSPLAPS